MKTFQQNICSSASYYFTSDPAEKSYFLKILWSALHFRADSLRHGLGYGISGPSFAVGENTELV